MVSCQYSFRHVIEIQEMGFKKFGTELRRVVGLHQILAGNVITCLEPLQNCQCRFKFWGCSYTVVSRKYAPPFATLALVQTVGGAYTRDATFSLAITPSLDREMFSGSVDAGFVLALPFHHGDLQTDCVGVSTREGSGGRA